MPDETQVQPQMQLFTVRIWLDGTGQPQGAWRGKVQHPASGAWRYFQDWAVLTAFLQSQLAELAAQQLAASSTAANEP